MHHGRGGKAPAAGAGAGAHPTQPMLRPARPRRSGIQGLGPRRGFTRQRAGVALPQRVRAGPRGARRRPLRVRVRAPAAIRAARIRVARLPSAALDRSAMQGGVALVDDKSRFAIRGC